MTLTTPLPPNNPALPYGALKLPSIQNAAPEGHPFYGNQYVISAGSASESASAASKNAEEATGKATQENTKASHKRAEKLHLSAANAHNEAADLQHKAGDETKSKEHEALAEKHFQARAQHKVAHIWFSNRETLLPDHLENRGGLTILNREAKHPADGWYQIEQRGETPNDEAGVIQTIDDAAVESIVNTFRGEALTFPATHKGASWPGMVIDIDHLKHLKDKETRAYGWLKDVENRGGDIFGKIEWTPTGKAAVDGKEFQFFSSEYKGSDLQVLNRDSKPLRVRPIRLDGLSLTNMNRDKKGVPITNRDTDQFRPGAGAPSAGNTNYTTPKRMTKIATALGKPADATEDTLAQAATELLNTNKTLTNRVSELEAANKDLLTVQVDADMKRFENRIKPEALDAVKKALLANRASTIATLEALAEPGKPAKAPLYNRGTAPDPKSNPLEDTTSPEAVEKANKSQATGIEEAISALRNSDRGLGYQQARDQVRRQHPELFGEKVPGQE